MIFSRQINQFIAVARAGSFIRAADAIAVTPSALSHGIHELEQRLGKKLMIRKKSGITLTRAGEKLYRQIAPLYDEATTILRQTCSETNKFAICSDGFFYPGFQQKIHQLAEKAGRHTHIKYGTAKNIFVAISDEKYDIAFGVARERDALPRGIARIALPPEKLGMLVADGVKTPPLALLRKARFFQRSSTLEHPVFGDIIQQLRQCAIHGDFTGLPDILDVCGMVLKGKGLSLITEAITRHPVLTDLKLHFLPLPDTLTINIHRAIYFKEDRSDELLDIVTALQTL